MSATCKYAGWTRGQDEALLNVLATVGGDIAYGLASGALSIERVGAQVIIQEAVKKLFDKNGRRIPPQGLMSAVCDANREFHIKRPLHNTEARVRERYMRFQNAFGVEVLMNFVEFMERSNAIQKRVLEDKRTENLEKGGVGLPIIIPPFLVSDYGKTLAEQFIPAVEHAYTAQFPNRSFHNYRKGQLEGNVSIVDVSRYEVLLERMAGGCVVARFYPAALQGFPVLACREQMSDLPEWILLSGGFDTASAMIGYPDIMARDQKTLVYSTAALQYQNSSCSLCFHAHAYSLNFTGKGDLGSAYVDSSGGLLVLG